MTILPWQGTAASTDSLRAVLDTVFAAPDYRWAQQTSVGAHLLRWWLALQRWLDQIKVSHPALFWVLFWGLVVLLVAIFVHGAWVTVQTLRAAGGPQEVEGPAAPESHGAAWHRREAQRLAREGAYPEAMQADFLALVLELDQRQLLRYHPSKTPNEYTYEVKLSEAGRDAFREVVRSLYGFAFARRPCGPEEFSLWRTLSSPERFAPAH